MVTEIPETQGGQTEIPEKEIVEPVIGLSVIFCTTGGSYPAVIVRYDPSLMKANLQVANKESDGWSLIKGVPHISKGKSPCWATRDEAPIDGIQSHPAPKPAYVRAMRGKVVP